MTPVILPPGRARFGTSPTTRGCAPGGTAHAGEYDRDHVGGALRGQGRRRTDVDDDLGLETDELRREGGKPIVSSFVVPVIDGEVLPLRVAELTKPHLQRFTRDDGTLG